MRRTRRNLSLVRDASALIAAGFFVCTELALAAAAPTNAPSDAVRAAIAFEHGEGVPRDPLKAAYMYCQAARGFDAEAMYRLGWMYAYGRGVPRDEAIAAGLFARAAAAGYEHAAQAQALMGGVERRLPECILAAEFAELVAKFPRAEPSAYAGPDPFAALPPAKKRIADVVQRLAPGYAIDTRLALAVIAVESNFNAEALSHKGAAGLMQLIPDTAARFNVKSIYDIHDNLRGGLAYLRWLLSYYRGQVRLAAAAYNAGEMAVDRYGGIPPYAETRDYVRRVLHLYGSELHPYDPRIVDPSPAVGSLEAERR